jgi:hypothetical protein
MNATIVTDSHDILQTTVVFNSHKEGSRGVRWCLFAFGIVNDSCSGGRSTESSLAVYQRTIARSVRHLSAAHCVAVANVRAGLDFPLSALYTFKGK